MITLKGPVDEQNQWRKINPFLKGKIPENFPDKVVQYFVKLMRKKDPQKRPSLDEILETVYEPELHPGDVQVFPSVAKDLAMFPARY